MDPRFLGFISSSDGNQVGSRSLAEVSNGNLLNGPGFGKNHSDQITVNGHRFGDAFSGNNFFGDELLRNVPVSNDMAPSSGTGVQEECEEDCDFSDAVLTYINQILMEEEMEDKTHMLQESLDLQAKEKAFYDVIGKKYPPSPEINHSSIGQHCENLDDYFLKNNDMSSSGSGNGYLIDVVYPRSIHNHIDSYTSLDTGHKAFNAANSSVSSSNSVNNAGDGLLDSPNSPLQASDLYENQSISNFRKGVEAASKFLPGDTQLLVNLDLSNDLLTQKPQRVCDEEAVKVEKRDEAEHSSPQRRGRKNPHREGVDVEERSSKQAAVYTEPIVRSKEFDIVLLHTVGEGERQLAAYRADLQNATSKNIRQNGQTKGSGGGKGRGKKQNKKEVIDLRTLLINCAQAVAADDRRSANELLKQIRQHSSALGDGNQRLAHSFADGLEGRLAGTGSQLYKSLVNKRTIAADYLKAYHLYLASCPFTKISNFAANITIKKKSQKSMRLHIIDFGILYGFQWPTFIQRIAEREGGPPMLRITGIDFPQPGFRPAERIEETGRRLTDYAKEFNVPFEYQAIAKNWESIRLEDLKIDKDEFLVVNCLYRTKNLLDETVMAESSRTIVLNLIKRVNPDIFIHGIVNGAYSAPFFVTRFREALFHFSALFDMLETNVPREKPERLLIEREIFGREALNVIACEGWERVERPETYKQWQVRNLRAGFLQIPFEREIRDKAIKKVKSSYHKDFVIDEGSQWLMLGWKGRIIYALSCWKPV